MKRLSLWLVLACTTVAAHAQSQELHCDLSGYRAVPGMTAKLAGPALVVNWRGGDGDELRAELRIDQGQPVISEFAVRHAGSAWTTLGRDLAPEFEVTSGVRRMSAQQAEPLRALGVEITPAVVEKEKWYAFWDAPLRVPGTTPGRPARNIGLPRKPEEIRHAQSRFASAGCTVKTNAARLEITFPGLALGIFAGELRFTVYRDSSLLRMEAIAKTEEPSVAYKYSAGLSGF